MIRKPLNFSENTDCKNAHFTTSQLVYLIMGVNVNKTNTLIIHHIPEFSQITFSDRDVKNPANRSISFNCGNGYERFNTCVPVVEKYEMLSSKALIIRDGFVDVPEQKDIPSYNDDGQVNPQIFCEVMSDQEQYNECVESAKNITCEIE